MLLRRGLLSLILALSWAWVGTVCARAGTPPGGDVHVIITCTPKLIDRYTVTATTPQAVGVGWTETVTACDAGGNLLAYNGVTVDLTSSTGNAVFYTNGTYTVTTTTATLTDGTATIYVKDATIETVKLTVTDGNGKTGTSGNIVVGSAAPVTHYRVTSATPQTVGVGWTATVTALDADDNTVVTATNDVDLSHTGSVKFYTDGTYATELDPAVVTLVAGEAIIHLKDAVAETVTVTATDGALNTGTSGDIVVGLAAGTLKLCGANDRGELGDATETRRLTPVATVPALAGATMAAQGESHTLALLEDGTVRAWGYNHYGQLGTGNKLDSKAPVAVPGLAGVTAVAVGRYHSLALMSDGTVKAWGANSYGQLGTGDKVQRLAPVAVPGLGGVVAIAAGRYHSVAVLASGEVRAWGLNSRGQLGDGTTTLRLVPVAVLTAPGVHLAGVTGIAAGCYHAVAVKTDGTVASWGYNYYGQLGLGTRTTGKLAAAVPGLGDVGMVACGSDHTVALLTDGTVQAWGNNSSGQLGTGTTTRSLTPVQTQLTPGVDLSGVRSIAAGLKHTVALMNDGTVKAWGYNFYGQLGNDTRTTSRLPVPMAPGTLSGVVAVSAGGNHSGAIAQP